MKLKESNHKPSKYFISKVRALKNKDGVVHSKIGWYESSLGIVSIQAFNGGMELTLILNGLVYRRYHSVEDWSVARVSPIPSDRSLLTRAGKFQREILKKYGDKE